MPPSVTVHIASFNTRDATELCIRTLRRNAGYLHQLIVGDAGSSDGSIAMLQDFESKGWLELEICPDRGHADWLDTWREQAHSSLLVFVDSDMDFRRKGWLCDLVQKANDSHAALVAQGFRGPTGGVREPVKHRLVTVMAAPTTWLFMINEPAVRNIHTSFKGYSVETSIVPEGCVVYDTAAAFLECIEGAGLSYVSMPRSYSRKVKHYGSMSWGDQSGKLAQYKRRVVRRRVRAARAHDQKGPQWHLVIAHPVVEAVREFLFRLLSAVDRRVRMISTKLARDSGL